MEKFRIFSKGLISIHPLPRKVKTSKFHNTQTFSTMKASLKEEGFLKFSNDRNSKKIEKLNRNIDIKQNISDSDLSEEKLITVGEINPGYRRNN